MSHDDFKMALELFVHEMKIQKVDPFPILENMLNEVAFNEWIEKGNNPKLFEWFKDPSTRIGLQIESSISDNSVGLYSKPKSRKAKSFDLILSTELVCRNGLVGDRLEVKVARATHKSEEVYWRRAMKRSEGRYTGTFQQVKKSEADYGLFFVIYSDIIDVYWVPYSCIGSSVKLHKQHLGHLTEGQVALSDTFEHFCYIGQIESFSDLNLFNFELER